MENFMEQKVLYCQRKLLHTIAEGDTLYKLAKQYDTTVTDLILGNPNANPYNLRNGAKLNICPGPNYFAAQEVAGEGNEPQQAGAVFVQPAQGSGEISPQISRQYTERDMQPMQDTGQIPYSTQSAMQPAAQPMQDTGQIPYATQSVMQPAAQPMQIAWMNRIFWMRMYLMSVNWDGKDAGTTEERFLETADEITDAFAESFPAPVVRELRNLMRLQLSDTAELVRSVKDGKATEELTDGLYASAQDMAELLNRQNSCYDSEKTRNMLFDHLDLTRQEIGEQLSGRYEEGIDTFDELENRTTELSDYLTGGLMR